MGFFFFFFFLRQNGSEKRFRRRIGKTAGLPGSLKLRSRIFHVMVRVRNIPLHVPDVVTFPSQPKGASSSRKPPLTSQGLSGTCWQKAVDASFTALLQCNQISNMDSLKICFHSKKIRPLRAEPTSLFLLYPQHPILCLEHI